MELKGRITVYSTSGCPHCKAAKAKLDELKLPFTEVNLDENPDYRSKVTKITGKRTVPQIFFNGTHIGGNDDFQKLSSEELERLITEVTESEVTANAPPVPPGKFLGRITVYSISGCPHCKAAKTYLDELNLPYTDVNLDDNPDLREPMIKISNRRTVPQIFFNEIHVGGNDDLKKLTGEELDKLTEEIRMNPAPPDGPPVPGLASVDVKNGDACVAEQEDESAKLVHEFRNCGVVRDHRQMLTVHKNCFSGADLVSWIMERNKTDREQAFETAKGLFQFCFLSGIHGDDTFKDDNTLYRLLQDEPSNALNANVVVDIKPMQASELAVQIRKQILKLYGEFLSPDGKCVDYDGMKRSELFKDYVQLTGQLQRINVSDMSREEKLAFFINIYNALVIHGNVEMGCPNSTWQRYKFFNDVAYRIGGLNYSLQDIENGILRSNRKGIGMLTKPFSKSDARLKVALEKHEPLIHFALVCGAKSCPPIKTYSADGIMDQLKCSAEAFLEGEDGCQLDEKKHIVKLSKIMDWYKADFGEDTGKVVDWVCECLPNCPKKERLSKMIEDKHYKVSYMPYDWGTNKKHS